MKYLHPFTIYKVTAKFNIYNANGEVDFVHNVEFPMTSFLLPEKILKYKSEYKPKEIDYYKINDCKDKRKEFELIQKSKTNTVNDIQRNHFRKTLIENMINPILENIEVEKESNDI